MRGSYPNRPGPDRPFVVTPYFEGPGGLMKPEVPGCCPGWSGPGDGGCRVRIRHWRPRKTGPRFPLAVVGCDLHGFGAFTLYPPGYAPYRRQAVLQVAADGSLVHGDGDRLPREFAQTVFEAALDAKEGRPWPRETKGEPERSWGTQGRHLELASQLVGVACGLADRVREAISTVLSIGALHLRDASQARGYRGVGRAVCLVLERLRGGCRRAAHLLICGHLIGHWGEPLHWDVRRRAMERSPFSAGGAVGMTSATSAPT